MGKGVCPYHRLVGLNHKTSGLADHTTGGHDLRRVNSNFQPKIVLAGTHCHDNLFQRAVASSLSQAIDGALDLTSAADLHPGQ